MRCAFSCVFFQCVMCLCVCFVKDGSARRARDDDDDDDDDDDGGTTVRDTCEG